MRAVLNRRTGSKYFSGIYRKTLFITVPVVVACTLAIVVGILFMLRTAIWDIYEKSVLSGVEALAGQLSCQKGDLKKISKILESSRKSRFRYFVYGSNTKPFYWSKGTPDPQTLLHAGLNMLGTRKALAARGGYGHVNGVIAAARPDNEHILVLAEDARRLQGLKWRGMLIISGLIISLIIAVVLLMSRLLVIPMLKRMETLKTCISRFGSGERESRLETRPEKRDEFDEVFEGFNSMAERICEYEREMARMAGEEKALLAQLAHDINTPISILRANAENLNVYGDSLPPDKRHGIQTDMLAQCIYIQALVDDLLTMASAKVAEISVNPSMVLLDDILDSIVNTFSPVAEQKGIVLLADGRGLAVWADPVRLRQILTNLVKNSIVHGGNVSIIEIDARLKGEMVSILVRDDGQGIKADKIDTLFERFQRDANNKLKGWGLGLAIVKMLSELQGGTCLFHSSEDGAVFEVILLHGPAAGSGK